MYAIKMYAQILQESGTDSYYLEWERCHKRGLIQSGEKGCTGVCQAERRALKQCEERSNIFQ